MDRVQEIRERLEKYKPEDGEILDGWLLRVHRVADELCQKDIPYLLRRLELAEVVINTWSSHLDDVAIHDKVMAYNAFCRGEGGGLE